MSRFGFVKTKIENFVILFCHFMCIDLLVVMSGHINLIFSSSAPNVTQTELFMNKKVDVIKNKLVKTIPVLNKNFEISFDVYPTNYAGGWKSVLHMTQGGNKANYGDRIPGKIHAFLREGKSDKTLKFIRNRPI